MTKERLKELNEIQMEINSCENFLEDGWIYDHISMKGFHVDGTHQSKVILIPLEFNRAVEEFARKKVSEKLRNLKMQFEEL